MLYAKWLFLAALDWLLLLTVPIAAPAIAMFTRQTPYGQAPYTWGWLWGTYDNPPQGDEGFVRSRCLFPGFVTGLRGYVNRVHWMIRNPLYGLARMASVEWLPGTAVTISGNPDISDKYLISGWYFAKAARGGVPVAFELYCVFPWRKTMDLRVRFGWKIATDKFEKFGFAQLVNTCNPFDGYGDK